jgi:hypothetical protein
VQARVELAVGMRHLSDYLAKWAAFDSWLQERGKAA